MSAYRMAKLSSVVRPSSTFSNVFFSETTGPIEAKFHVEPPWDGERKLVRGSRSQDQDGRLAYIW